MTVNVGLRPLQARGVDGDVVFTQIKRAVADQS